MRLSDSSSDISFSGISSLLVTPSLFISICRDEISGSSVASNIGLDLKNIETVTIITMIMIPKEITTLLLRKCLYIRYTLCQIKGHTCFSQLSG